MPDEGGVESLLATRFWVLTQRRRHCLLFCKAATCAMRKQFADLIGWWSHENWHSTSLRTSLQKGNFDGVRPKKPTILGVKQHTVSTCCEDCQEYVFCLSRCASAVQHIDVRVNASDNYYPCLCFEVANAFVLVAVGGAARNGPLP